MRILLLVLLFFPGMSFGHSLSDSYIELTVDDENIKGHWLIAVRDLELAVGVDSNTDGRVSWGELKQKSASINLYVLSRMQLHTGDSQCDLNIEEHMVEELSAGMFLRLPLTGLCDSTRPLRVTYDLLFDVDTSHRGIATVYQSGEVYSVILSPSSPVVTIDADHPSSWSHFRTFLLEGIWHIWIGLDHILFLVALLVPIVMNRHYGVVMVGSRSRMSVSILQVVTAFTVAHSITLILATLDWVVLPGRLVESLIALSVAVSGLNILYPIFRGYHWQIAFAFGLIHGFGFAGVLGDLALPAQLFVGSLLAFNIGVEIGQLVIVGILVPILLVLGNLALARKLTLATTGVLITGFGVVWVMERYWNLSLNSLV